MLGLYVGQTKGIEGYIWSTQIKRGLDGVESYDASDGEDNVWKYDWVTDCCRDALWKAIRVREELVKACESGRTYAYQSYELVDLLRYGRFCCSFIRVQQEWK